MRTKQQLLNLIAVLLIAAVGSILAISHLGRKRRMSLASVSGLISNRELHTLKIYTKKTMRLPGVIVEIGSYLGKSSIAIATEAKKHGDHVYCIDTWDNSIYEAIPPQSREKYIRIPQDAEQQFLQNIKLFSVDKTITAIKGKSEDIARDWKEPIKLLFIDACHEYEYVIKDSSLWKDHIVRGGLLLFHNYDRAWPGVIKAVDDTIGKDREFYSIDQQGELKIFAKGEPYRATALDRLHCLIYDSIENGLKHWRGFQWKHMEVERIREGKQNADKGAAV